MVDVIGEEGVKKIVVFDNLEIKDFVFLVIDKCVNNEG